MSWGDEKYGDVSAENVDETASIRKPLFGRPKNISSWL